MMNAIPAVRPRHALTGLIGLLTLAAFAPAQSTQSEVASKPSDQMAAIEAATDPSAAVEAYAKARAAAPDDPQLTVAYVRRMVALGAPQLAEKQAEEVVQQNPQDGIAWAVLAYCSGAANDTTAALSELVSAARLAPDNRFVQHTAGQLLGWYDVLGTAGELPPGLPEALEKIKQDLGERRAFANAYKGAREFYRQQEAAASAPKGQGEEQAADSPEVAAAEPLDHDPPAAAMSAPSSAEAAPPVEDAAPPEHSTEEITAPEDDTAPEGSDEMIMAEPLYEDVEIEFNVGSRTIYVDTPVFTAHYPTYIVPPYYPAWSVGVCVGWGYPWYEYGCYYPWRVGWVCGYPRWGWVGCPPRWYGWTGWGGCGVVPYGRHYVRCDRVVHRHLTYGLRTGHRPYANRTLVGVARHGNGAYLAGAIHRREGVSRGGYVAGGSAARAGSGAVRAGPTRGSYGALNGPGRRSAANQGVRGRSGPVVGGLRGSGSSPASIARQGGAGTPREAAPANSGPLTRRTVGAPSNRPSGSFGSTSGANRQAPANTGLQRSTSSAHSGLRRSLSRGTGGPSAGGLPWRAGSSEQPAGSSGPAIRGGGSPGSAAAPQLSRSPGSLRRSTDGPTFRHGGSGPAPRSAAPVYRGGSGSGTSGARTAAPRQMQTRTSPSTGGWRVGASLNPWSAGPAHSPRSGTLRSEGALPVPMSGGSRSHGGDSRNVGASPRGLSRGNLHAGGTRGLSGGMRAYGGGHSLGGGRSFGGAGRIFGGGGRSFGGAHSGARGR